MEDVKSVKSRVAKRGFTLFEVIISLVIFSVLLISLLRLNHNDNGLGTYYQLQVMENEYNESGSLTSTEGIKLNQ